MHTIHLSQQGLINYLEFLKHKRAEILHEISELDKDIDYFDNYVEIIRPSKTVEILAKDFRSHYGLKNITEYPLNGSWLMKVAFAINCLNGEATRYEIFDFLLPICIQEGFLENTIKNNVGTVLSIYSNASKPKYSLSKFKSYGTITKYSIV